MKIVAISVKAENALGENWEIAHDEQFLPFPQFSRKLYCIHVKARACLGKVDIEISGEQD